MLNIKDDTMEASQISKETVKTFISDVQVVIENWKREIEPNKNELLKNVQEIENSLKELEAAAPSSKN
jgi:gas vesicle protein